MDQYNRRQPSETELQALYVREGDNSALFEFQTRYKPIVMTIWKNPPSFLFRRYPEDCENFFDDLLKEAVVKWDPTRATFYTFFVRQVCRRRTIDFARKLRKRYNTEARLESGFCTPTGEEEDSPGILDRIPEPIREYEGYPEQDIELFRTALEREKPDCQALLWLMLTRELKKFEEKAEILAIMGFRKKPTGWRDTWKRNRERIAAYIVAEREKG